VFLQHWAFLPTLSTGKFDQASLLGESALNLACPEESLHVDHRRLDHDTSKRG
jgi:hypothetical protein